MLSGQSSFNTWAREEPNSIAVSSQPSDLRFNTWAREEPNTAKHQTCNRHHVSILGLARSPTVETGIYAPEDVCFNTWAREEPNDFLIGMDILSHGFQYLGSRGAQRTFSISSMLMTSFQYLGSRGAQPALSGFSCVFQRVSILGLARSPTGNCNCNNSCGCGFNTWAREEPNCE